MNSFQSFLDYLRLEKRFSDHTLQAYRTDLRQFLNFLESNCQIKNPARVGADEVRSWLYRLKNPESGRALSSRSINRKISSLRSYYKYLKRNGLIEKDPMLKIAGPKSEKRLPVFIEQKEMQGLLDYLEGATGFKALRERLIIELFYATGMRRAELIGLKTRDIDFGDASLKVLGKGKKERIIPISEKMLTLIGDYLQAREEEIETDAEELLVSDNGRPLQPGFVYNTVNRLIGRVSAVQKKSPHVLRHSFATHLLNNGSPLNAIKELLGHSNLAATQIYTHGKIEELKEIYRQSHPKSE